MPLPYLPQNPNLQCKRIKKNGEQCKNPKAYGTPVCRYHGATPKLKRKFGSSNGNYKTGYFTQVEMLARQRNGSEMDAIKDLGLMVGLWDKKSGIKKGRPYTVHSDTHANQVLQLAQQMFLDHKQIRNFTHGRLIELIKDFEFKERYNL